MSKVISFQCISTFSSYGIESNLPSYRDTNSFPTKSAIIGMCLNALGHDKYDVSGIEEPKVWSDKTRIGILDVSVKNKDGVFIDLQQANRSDKKQQLDLIHKAYLLEKRFIIFIECSDDDAAILYKALCCPYRTLYYGRANCMLESSSSGEPFRPLLKEGVLEDNMFLTIVEENKEKHKEVPLYIEESFTNDISTSKNNFLKELNSFYDGLYNVFFISRSLKNAVAECFYPNKIKYRNLYYYTSLYIPKEVYAEIV